MEQYNFYAYIARMKYINRWGLMRNTSSENIQEHSLQVAILAHALALIKNKYFEGKLNPDTAGMYGVFHDSSEIITGDLPTPVKYYNPEIKDSYGKLEDISKEKLLSMLPEDFKEDYRDIIFYEQLHKEYYPVIKAADKLSAYIKCLEEVKAGNNEFNKAKEATLMSLYNMNLPEVEYFLKYFVNAYFLTLDELD